MSKTTRLFLRLLKIKTGKSEQTFAMLTLRSEFKSIPVPSPHLALP